MKKKLTTEAKIKSSFLTSLNEQEHQLLLEEFDRQVTRKLKRYTLKGHPRQFAFLVEDPRCSLQGSALKLDFVLVYLKQNLSQCMLGFVYTMSQSKVSEWLCFLLPVLENSLAQLGFTAQYGDVYHHPDREEDFLAGDVCERQIPRNHCYKAQQKEYSGKHKKHTLKHFALCNPQSRIHFLSRSYVGCIHDKTIWDELTINVQGNRLFLDLGFLGADHQMDNVILPFKRPQKGELNTVQKQLNKAISSVRVVIEHAFAGVKRLRTVADKIRIRGTDKRERVFRIAVALHNLRVDHRRPIQNCS